MAEITSNNIGAWEKPRNPNVGQLRKDGGHLKFLVGGFILIAVIVYLVVSGTLTGAQYFMTVDHLLSNPEYVGQTVRIAGAVIGDTIDYDSENLILNFTIVNIPDNYDNLALALHESVNNPDATRLQIHMPDTVKPDLLQHEAQAILMGTLDENGVFHATEVLVKCPSRFEEAEPGKEIVEPGL